MIKGDGFDEFRARLKEISEEMRARARAQQAEELADDEFLASLVGAPSVQLSVRIRKPLDDALADLVHELRSSVRTNKTELVEIAIAGLVRTPEEELVEVVHEFREITER